jgi:nicotinamide mononucleotide adenylyltransferase
MHKEALHIVPINDLREHIASTDCWCKPTEDVKFDDIWIHHSMDKREEYEEGRKPT